LYSYVETEVLLCYVFMMIMTWLLEMYDIYPLRRFVENFMHVALRLIEDVTTIS